MMLLCELSVGILTFAGRHDIRLCRDSKVDAWVGDVASRNRHRSRPDPMDQRTWVSGGDYVITSLPPN